MTVHGDLLKMLEAVADALGDDLRERLVFVGGCTTALFITDPITLEDVRATDDVDLIVDLAGTVEWAALQKTLRKKGFTDRLDNDVICRMWLDALQVDFMPDDADILGFGNRWYARGIETAVTKSLTGGREVKVLTPPLFLATKLEAYRGRGGDDPLKSRDLEDVLLVVDGRRELIAEVEAADADIRSFIAAELRGLQRHRDFHSFVEGNIGGPAGRADIVRDRLDDLARCDGGG